MKPTIQSSAIYAERLARFAQLQRRAQQLLAASPEGYRRYWERNLRKRRDGAPGMPIDSSATPDNNPEQ